MKTVIGLALIFAIAYGLLRVLAWLGLCWERGYVFEPSDTKSMQLGHQHQSGFTHATYISDVGIGNNVTAQDVEPWINIDGTPMISGGLMDVRGNLYGTTHKSFDD